MSGFSACFERDNYNRKYVQQNGDFMKEGTQASQGMEGETTGPRRQGPQKHTWVSPHFFPVRVPRATQGPP